MSKFTVFIYRLLGRKRANGSVKATAQGSLPTSVMQVPKPEVREFEAKPKELKNPIPRVVMAVNVPLPFYGGGSQETGGAL